MLFQCTMATLARLTSSLIVFTILWGCSAQPAMWMVDSIAAGDRSFDSSRLRYIPKQAHAPLAFEMMKIGNQIDGYISLNRFRFKATEQIKVIFTIADQSFEEQIPVHEGGMRIHLSPETTEKVIKALQEGHKIAILLDDFEEILDPAQFSGIFAKFIGEGHFFQNFFKGPIP